MNQLRLKISKDVLISAFNVECDSLSIDKRWELYKGLITKAFELANDNCIEKKFQLRLHSIVEFISGTVTAPVDECLKVVTPKSTEDGIYLANKKDESKTVVTNLLKVLKNNLIEYRYLEVLNELTKPFLKDYKMDNELIKRIAAALDVSFMQHYMIERLSQKEDLTGYPDIIVQSNTSKSGETSIKIAASDPASPTELFLNVALGDSYVEFFDNLFKVINTLTGEYPSTEQCCQELLDNIKMCLLIAQVGYADKEVPQYITSAFGLK